MLIKCPECGKEISSEAVSCPHCGYPIKKNLDLVMSERSENSIRDLYMEGKEFEKVYKACFIVGLLLVVVGGVLFGLGLAPIGGQQHSSLITAGAIIAPLGLVIAIVGCSIFGTKYNNRARIVNDYLDKHPGFKLEE